MSAPPRTTIERYFSLHYGLGQAPLTSGCTSLPSANSVDTCVARHHNGLCVVCISPQHPVVTCGLQIRSVEYRTALRAVRGKRKRGGTFVEARTRLCTIVCDNGLSFNVQCSVRGVLVEYNDVLQENAGLVVQEPLTRGYLAVVLPPTAEIGSATDALCAADEYAQRIEKNQVVIGDCMEIAPSGSGNG